MGIRSAIGKLIGGKALKEEVMAGSTSSNVGGGIDPDDSVYRRLSGSQRELPPLIQQRALRLAWQMYESNPLAKGIIETMKDHVVGDGFGVEAQIPEVKAVLDQHWHDPQNLWDLKQHDRVRELSLFGELLFTAFVNEANGHVRLASIDPLNVKDVWLNKDNPEEVIAIVVNDRLNYGASTGSWQNDKVYRVVHVDEEPNSITLGKMIGAAKGEMYHYPKGGKDREYDGSCFWFTINKVTGAKRGRSDLLASLDWLDVNDQVHMNFADRTLLMSAFIWDVELTGATEMQVQAYMAKYGKAPRSGTVRVHNETEKWNSVSPDFQSQQFDVEARSLKQMILAAPGLPLHWFGDQDANKATAVEMGSPAIKRLSARQLYVKYMIEHILRFVIDQAVIAGVLVEPELDANGNEARHEFKIIRPEISVRDNEQAANALLSATQAITMVWQAGLIDDIAARRIFALLAQQLGAEIDVSEMEERMGKAAEAAGIVTESRVAIIEAYRLLQEKAA